MREDIKNVVLNVIAASGAFRLARRRRRSRVAALTYHHVLPDRLAGRVRRTPNIVFESEFDRQISYIARDFHVVTGAELRAFLRGTASLPPYSVVITFDDGYRNNYSTAFPILRRYGVTAVFFLSTGFVRARSVRLWFDRFDRALAANSGRADPSLGSLLQEASGYAGLRTRLKLLPPRSRDEIVARLEEAVGPVAVAGFPAERIEPMTWDEAREMASAGMTIGAHTCTHTVLSAMDADQVESELRTSRLAIEQALQRECWAFSYPNGERRDFRATDLRAVQEAGYECAFTQLPGHFTETDNRYTLPRLQVPSSPYLAILQSRVTGFEGFCEPLRRRLG